MNCDPGHAAITYSVEAFLLSFKNLLASGFLAAATTVPFAAGATTFLTFSQTGSDIVTATDNGTATTISVTDGTVSIGSIDAAGISTPVAAYLTLNATSDGSASISNGYTNQNFTGTFSITDGGSINYLSGTFTDALGSGKSASFTLTASQPPTAELASTSSVISGADLSELQALSLSFTNVSPQVSIDGSTLAGFSSNVSGTFSGTYPTPEPASFALLIVGLSGIGFLRLRRG